MIYKIVPYFIFKRLWGDRKRFGLNTDFKDKDFVKWLSVYEEFYSKTQKNRLGTWVCHLGFKITGLVDFSNKTIGEVGPGYIEHTQYHKQKCHQYILIDIKDEFLNKSELILKDSGYEKVQKIKVDGPKIKLPDNSVDVLISFHQLEHIVEIENYVTEIKRVLKKGGILVGAIPTEGGLAWGLGRFLTTRRFCRKNFDFNFDKVICWEHPNFADKVKKTLEKNFKLRKQYYRPFRLPVMDINLSYSFIFEKE